MLRNEGTCQVKPNNRQDVGVSIPPSANSELRLSASELAGALHEVSNALTVVLGWLEVAQRNMVGDTAREALDVALRQARLGYRVARRAIGASTPLENGSGALQDIVSGAILAVRPLAEQRRVQLTHSAPSEVVAWLPNPDAATQVLINLLLNAIAFSPEGKSVTLHCELSDSQALVLVRDEGPGIDDTRAAKIWDAPVSTRFGGAGIGLSYCRRLALEHGADLRLLRQAQSGAAFQLKWPTVDAETDEPDLVLAAPRNLRGLRILLVEDDAAICSLVELAFEAQGSTVVSAGNLAAIERAKRSDKAFDLVLVDLSPLGPDLEAGLAALKSGLPEIPMVLITGSAANLPEGGESAFAAWVRKPFEAGELVTAVRQIRGE